MCGTFDTLPSPLHKTLFSRNVRKNYAGTDRKSHCGVAHVSLADWVCSLAEDFASAHTPSDDMKDMDEDCFIQRRWQGRKSTYVRYF